MTLLAVVLGAYLLGAVPFGLLLGRMAAGVDVREQGSGNIGATNVARSLGAWAGILTLLLDTGKGAFAVWAAKELLGEGLGPPLAGLAALAGHVFPVYLRFRGGKGVATAWGAFAVLSPVAALGVLALFLLTVACTRRVSPGSLLGAIFLPVILASRGAAPALTASAIAAAAVIVARHRTNLRKLMDGTEPRLGGGNR